VTALRALDRAVDLTLGDHVSWVYDDLDGLRAACVDTFTEGAARGEQLVYIGDRNHGDLEADLAGLEGREVMLESGRLRIHSIAELYRVTSTFRPQAQVEAFPAEAQQAVREGYTGLRVVGDVTDIVGNTALWDTFVDYELALESMYAETPVIGICALDRGRVGERWRDISCLHRIQHVADGQPTFALTFADGVVRLFGEVDAASVDELRGLLDAVLGMSDDGLEVSLKGLDFIDVAGSRVLASAHRQLDAGGRQMVISDVKRSAALPLRVFRLEGGAGL
jgi:anti-anti-sigma factor